MLTKFSIFLSHIRQKSRLSALEYLRTSNARSIVVASDVVGFTTFILPIPSQLFVLSVPHPFCAFQAARGLDIPSVTTVIHYDVARVIDTFIHRSGRTAVSYFVGFLFERTVPSLNLLVQCIMCSMTIVCGLESPTLSRK